MKIDKNSLRFKIWLYIMLFSVFILGLLWILQIVFLESFYEGMKKKEIAKIGNEIVAKYGDENFDDIITKYAYENNLRISLIDENGDFAIETDGFSAAIKKNTMTIDINEINDIKLKFPDKRGEPLNYMHNDKDRVQIAFISLLTNEKGENQYLSIKSLLPPIDSTVNVLKTQLIIITLILLILAFIVAQIISKKISVPITTLTKSADELAKGNLTVEFPIADYTEINQLSNTLSYATKELSKLDQYRKDFIANVSHDLKTPLTIIKCYGEMIRDVSFANPVKTQAHCEIIIKETDRLTGLVGEILELSKFQSNNAMLVKTEFDLSRCLHEILRGFSVLSKKQGYKFEVEIMENATVYADEQALKRAIYNLISNAINYTGEDKYVKISLIDLGKNIRFEVSDTGVGIPKDEIENIWERYYKTTQTHKRAVIGAGIGLSIVKNVLQLHDCNFGVESEVNAGSTFWFEIASSHDSIIC